MGTKVVMQSPAATQSDEIAKLLDQCACGPVKLTGAPDALYDQHLVFDNVVDLASASLRDRFEAFARSTRDVLSRRWVRSESAYARQDPKRVYYLSMEFLI